MNQTVRSVKAGRHGRANKGETVVCGLVKARAVMQNDTAPLYWRGHNKAPSRCFVVLRRTKIEPLGRVRTGRAIPSEGLRNPPVVWGASRGECESPGSWMSRAAKPPLDLAHAAPLNRGADGCAQHKRPAEGPAHAHALLAPRRGAV